MRGDKIIGGSSAQSATVFAGQVGPQMFRLRNRWIAAMTVGQEGTEVGVRTTVGTPFGKLEPPGWAEIPEITSLYALSNDFFIVAFPGDPFAGVNTLRVTLEGWGPMELSWNVPADNYQASQPGIYAYLTARVDQVLGVRYGKVS